MFKNVHLFFCFSIQGCISCQSSASYELIDDDVKINDFDAFGGYYRSEDDCYQLCAFDTGHQKCCSFAFEESSKDKDSKESNSKEKDSGENSREGNNRRKKEEKGACLLFYADSKVKLFVPFDFIYKTILVEYSWAQAR